MSEDYRNRDYYGFGFNFSGADLRGKDFARSSFIDVNFESANLEGANLRNTCFDCANLSNANLKNADITGASFDYVNLEGVNLRDAYLDEIKGDLFVVLDKEPTAVPALLDTLRQGNIDGTSYEGDCACLIGTIAHIVDRYFLNLLNIRPEPDRPIERWFVAIRPGHTPENHQIAAITAEWIEEWIAMHTEATP